MKEKKDMRIFFIPERVEEARRSAKAGIRTTNKEMAEKLGVSERHMSVILNGKAGVSYGLAEEIASLLGVPAVYLLGLVDNNEKIVSSWRTSTSSVSTAKYTQRSDVKMVPVVSSKVITGACGPGTAYTTEVEWEMEGFYPIPVEEMSSYGWNGNSLKIMVAEGSSMEPCIRDGDKVLFVEGAEVGEGDVVVISYRDRLFIKGIRKMSPEALVLGAFNWQTSPDIRVDFDGCEDDIKILGKVLSVISIKKIGPLA